MKNLAGLKLALIKAIDEYETTATRKGQTLSAMRLNDTKILRGFIFSARDYSGLVSQLVHYLKLLRADSWVWFRSRLRNRLLAVIKASGLNKPVKLLQANSSHWEGQSTLLQSENAQLKSELVRLECRMQALLQQRGAALDRRLAETASQVTAADKLKAGVEQAAYSSDSDTFDPSYFGEPSRVGSDSDGEVALESDDEESQQRTNPRDASMLVLDLQYIDGGEAEIQTQLQANVQRMVHHIAQLETEVGQLRDSNHRLSERFLQRQGAHILLPPPPRDAATPSSLCPPPSRSSGPSGTGSAGAASQAGF